MGSKQNPGQYDVYLKAEPDEPMFILLARDRLAPMLLKQWVEWEIGRVGHPTPKTDEALEVAEQMMEWRRKHIPSPEPV